LINPLKNYRILIIDSDMNLALVLKSMLGKMGFPNVHLIKSGKEAITLMQSMLFDFIITEWNTLHIDGIGMLEFMRRNPQSPNQTIPIIMLTGRAEQVDVSLARNYGVNEYVIKPFTAKSIYTRLERIIEHPRNFVMARSFIGPDRRTMPKPKDANNERRVRKIIPDLRTSESKININGEPCIWLPDLSLKLKLGQNMKLSDFITPQVLEQSQTAIDSITSISLKWINYDIQELKSRYQDMLSPSYPETIALDIGNIALAINSRAGTFGYSLAASIAYDLYIFTRKKLNPQNEDHRLIVQKHIQVLQVILGNQMQGDAGEAGEQIADELKSLVNKYSGSRPSTR